MFNVTENMLFSLNKSSTHRLPLQNAMRVQVIFLEKFARKICGDISYRYMVIAKRATVWNYQFLARGLCLSQFLARGNSCKKIFGSWWLVVGRGNQCFGSWWLAVGHGGLWWLVVACGGSCVVSDSITGDSLSLKISSTLKNLFCQVLRPRCHFPTP